MGLSTTHLLILLVIVIVIFGTKKLKNLGTDLGSAVKGFKDGMRDGDQAAAPAAPSAPAPAAPVQQVSVDNHAAHDTIDVEAKAKH